MVIPMDLSKKNLWLFDVDNTLIRDVEYPDPFPDALHLCEALERKGKTIAILTNVGRLSARQIHAVVTAAGFSFDADKTFSAGAVAAAYINNRSPRARCFVISEGGALEDFTVRGLNVTNNPPVDFVAVGADRNLTFQRLNFATKMVMSGAALICISGSRDYPGVYLGQEDVYIGERSIVAAIEDATGERALIIGKPMPEIFTVTVRTLGFDVTDAVMVGDNPASDVAGGKAAGLTTIIVKRSSVNIVPYDAGNLDTTADIIVNSLDEVTHRI
jgi:HAD superfamily hydrolase (TIGR01450 family)